MSDCGVCKDDSALLTHGRAKCPAVESEADCLLEGFCGKTSEWKCTRNEANRRTVTVKGWLNMKKSGDGYEVKNDWSVCA